MRVEKKNIKQWLVLPIIIVALIGAVFAGCDKNDKDESTTAATLGLNYETELNEENESDEETEVTVDVVSDGHHLEIKDCRVTEDYSGNPVAVIKYVFTNNSSETEAFWIAVDDAVYQNGEVLEKVYSLKDGDSFDSSNMNKDVESGETVEVEIAYALNDAETDIDVEAKVWCGFTSNLFTKTFSIK